MVLKDSGDDDKDSHVNVEPLEEESLAAFSVIEPSYLEEVVNSVFDDRTYGWFFLNYLLLNAI